MDMKWMSDDFLFFFCSWVCLFLCECGTVDSIYDARSGDELQWHGSSHTASQSLALSLSGPFHLCVHCTRCPFLCKTTWNTDLLDRNTCFHYVIVHLRCLGAYWRWCCHWTRLIWVSVCECSFILQCLTKVSLVIPSPWGERQFLMQCCLHYQTWWMSSLGLCLAL